MPEQRSDLEFQKFRETADGRIAVSVVLNEDSYTVLDARYVLLDTGTTIANLTETSNEAVQLNALLTRLRSAKLLSPTT